MKMFKVEKRKEYKLYRIKIITVILNYIQLHNINLNLIKI